MDPSLFIAGRGIYMMEEWNLYGDFFTIEDADGEGTWGNGRNDVIGFADGATIEAWFGIVGQHPWVWHQRRGISWNPTFF